MPNALNVKKLIVKIAELNVDGVERTFALIAMLLLKIIRLQKEHLLRLLYVMNVQLLVIYVEKHKLQLMDFIPVISVSIGFVTTAWSNVRSAIPNNHVQIAYKNVPNVTVVSANCAIKLVLNAIILLVSIALRKNVIIAKLLSV